MKNYLVLAILSICILITNNSCNENEWDLVWQDEFEAESIDFSQWRFDLGTGAPSFENYGISSPNFVPSGFPNDNFSVRWEGKIKIDQRIKNHPQKRDFCTDVFAIWAPT